VFTLLLVVCCVLQTFIDLPRYMTLKSVFKSFTAAKLYVQKFTAIKNVKVGNGRKTLDTSSKVNDEEEKVEGR
jgi:hypothetical protein